MLKLSLAGGCDLSKTKWLSKNYEQFSTVDGELKLCHFLASVVDTTLTLTLIEKPGKGL